MRRWNFVSGLTILLLLMLILSGYCVWVTRGLTSDLDRLIAHNYDKIRAIRDLRAAMTQINTRYLSSTAVRQAPASLGTFENESAVIREKLATVRQSPGDPGETERLDRLDVLTRDYLDGYATLFALPEAASARRDQIGERLAQATAEISQQAEALVELNEKELFARRDAAVARGWMFSWVALGIAGVSILIYIYTSVRLTQGIFQPLRRLRDAIQQVGRREFDAVEPLEGGEELNQIAQTFNQMARELRAYIKETDLRSVESSRISRAILAALPYPIYIVDEAYQVRLTNPRAEALSAALKISDHLPAAVRKCVDEAASVGSELVGDDLQRAVEIPLPPPGTGPTPTYLPQVFRMTDVPGSTTGWAVLLVDVTRLRQFDQAKTKAIATLGHEVKTPVTSIRMALHLLLEEKIGPLTADQRELVAAGRDDCERLLTVLQALLELARFESGRIQMRLTPTPPAELVGQAEAMHGSFFRGSDGAFVVEPPPDNLPLVHADAIHIVRVLGNFLSNAAKYRRPGTPVTLLAEARADGFVRFKVRNSTLRPFSEIDQARVFEPFYRRADEGAEGTGLGLTLCREIAVLHHGRAGVWAEGGDVEFYLDLRGAGVAVPAAAPRPEPVALQL